MSKKSWVLFLVCFVFMGLFIGEVSAQGFFRRGSEQLMEIAIDFTEPFLQAIFGGDDYTGELLFEKVLLFTLLLGVVYLALGKVEVFSDNSPVHWIVSVIIPILSVRFMNFEWINTMLIQYQVLGIALAGILPFIVYLFFLHNVFENNSVGRKIGWFFFIVIYFFLWNFSDGDAYGSVYFWTMLIAFAFLALDGTIHRAMAGQKWKQAEQSGYANAIANIDRQIDIIERSNIPSKQKERELKLLRKRRNKLVKQIT
jgi:hypothetical protein